MRNLPFICFGVLFFFPTPASADDPHPELAGLQARIDAVMQEVLPAVVAIQREENFHGSGVIISADGLVLTHGHHRIAASDPVFVLLSDGRSAQARIQSTGKTLLYDFSILRILDDDEWPHVELGEMDHLDVGDWCLHLGHPWGVQPERPPVPRMGWIVELAEVALASSCMIVGGDSGGPLFDDRGRLIGICRGLSNLSPEFPAEYTSIKALQRALTELGGLENLRQEGVLKTRIDRRPVLPEWQPAWEPAGAATVQINCDGERTVLGVIVDESGLILTKASELVGDVSCKLSNGEALAATIVSTSQPFDLALLQVQTTGLPTIPWAEDVDLQLATVVVVPGQDAVLGVGIITDPRIQSVSPDRGYLFFQSERTPDGMKVTELNPMSHASELLKTGDTITHFDGVDVRTLDDFTAYAESAERIAGDRVELSLVREDASIQASFGFTTEHGMFMDQLQDLSSRRSGFPSVFVHDTVISPQDCGGALVDAAGNVLGINIARADRHATYAIPMAIVLEELRTLKLDARVGSGISDEPTPDRL